MTQEDVLKIWFANQRIYLETKDGIVKSHPLEWFPRLLKATPEQRENYEFSPFGIHWEEIDEDISFDGFFSYDKTHAETQRNEIQLLLKRFPMLNISELARMAGISPAVMRHYACNVKQPSAARKKQIEKTLHKLGRELLDVSID